MRNRKREGGSIIIPVVIVLGLAYLMLVRVSLGGWGYMGHGGYHRGPSFWYMGGPQVYHEPSVRSGSQSGPGHTGGGVRGGK